MSIDLVNINNELVELAKRDFKKFKESFDIYDADISAKTLEEIILNLHKQEDVMAISFAELIVEERMADLATDFLAKFVIEGLNKTIKEEAIYLTIRNITLIEKLVKKIAENQNDVDINKLYFELVRDREAFNKKLYLLLDSGQMNERLFNHMVNNELFYNENMIIEIAPRLDNWILFLSEAIIDKRIAKDYLHHFFKNRDDVAKVFESSFALAVSKKAPEEISSIFKEIAKIFEKRFSSTINKAVFLEVLFNASKNDNHEAVVQLVKSLNGLYEQYLSSILAVELNEDDEIFFTETGYYIAKYLWSNPVNDPNNIGFNWPIANPAYGIFENCDFPTYLIIRHAIGKKDIKTADNVLRMFDFPNTLRILFGFMGHVIKQGLSDEQIDYILHSIKKTGNSQRHELEGKIIEILQDKEISGAQYKKAKTIMLTMLLKSYELSNEVKKNIVKLGFGEERLTEMFLGIIQEANLYEASFIVEALSESLNGESKDLVWNNIIKSDNPAFYPLIAKIICKNLFDNKNYDLLKELSPKLFAYCLHYANQAEVPELLEKYSENKVLFEKNISDIANVLVSLNSHNALKRVLHYDETSIVARMFDKFMVAINLREKTEKKEKILEVSLSAQRELLMQAITANNLETLDIVNQFLIANHRVRPFTLILKEACNYVISSLNIFSALYNAAHNLMNYILQEKQTKEEAIGRSLFNLCDKLHQNQVVVRELFSPEDETAQSFVKLKDFDDVSIMGISAYAIKAGIESSSYYSADVFTKAFETLSTANKSSIQIKDNLRKIGYENLNKLLDSGCELDNGFKIRANELLKTEYERMRWVERIFYTEPKILQLA